MAGVYPLLLVLLLLVAAAQLGLTAFLISCFDENGWPGQRESGPLIVKALYVSLFTAILLSVFCDLTYGLLVSSYSSSMLVGLCWARYCSSHSVTKRTQSSPE